MRIPSRFLPCPLLVLVACGAPATDSAPATTSGSTTTTGTPLPGTSLPVYDSRLEGAWPQPNVLESVDYPGADQAEAALHWTRFFDLVAFAPDEQIVLDRPMRMHRVEPVRDLTGPQDLEPVPGLRVAFDADEIGVDHPLPFPVEEVAFGAVALPAQDWPTALGDWTGLAAWGFAPWDLELDDGFAVSATLTEPIPAGHEAAFLVADYVTGFRDGTMEVEPALVSADRLVVSTPPDGGLNRTTLWVLATRPL